MSTPATSPVPLQSRLVGWVLGLTAAVFLVLAIVGVVHWYSPVPFLDMWPGAMKFYLRVQDGDGAAWWEMHNEHRIVLSRILFWMDYRWFEGRMLFLVAANLLIVLGAWTIWRAVLKAHPRPAVPATRRVVLAFVFACLYSWAQRDNLFWAFQSQFLLAQCLPLLALHLLSRAAVDGATPARLAGAFAVGILSLGTMANGVLALPVMAAYAHLARMGWRITVGLAIAGALGAAAYFSGFQPVAAHGPVGSAALREPLALLAYVCAFLGSPFFALAGYRGLLLAQAAGLAMLVLGAWSLWRVLRAPGVQRYELLLLAYLGFIVATAAGIGAGRLSLGVEHALTGRYTTPAIMGWIALLVLHMSPVAAAFERGSWKLLGPLVVLLPAMWVLQARALESPRQALFEWHVAALALELGIRDEAQIRYVSPEPDATLAIAAQAAMRDVGVFGRGPVHDATRRLGLPAPVVARHACRARVTETTQVPGSERFVKVRGSVEAPVSARGGLTLVDTRGRAVGTALVGDGQGEAPGMRKFKGYALREAAGGALAVAAADRRTCVAPAAN